MAEVHEDLLASFEASRKEPKRFQGQRDRDSRDRFIKDYVKNGAPVQLILRANQIRQVDGAHGGVDPLDGDLLDVSYIEQAVHYNFNAIVEHEPSRQLLTKFQIDEQREVIFNFPRVLLEEQGLVGQPLRWRGVAIGDVVEWDGTFYLVKNVHRRYYHGQTTHWYWTSAFCDRYRHTATPKHPEGPARPDAEVIIGE